MRMGSGYTTDYRSCQIFPCRRQVLLLRLLGHHLERHDVGNLGRVRWQLNKRKDENRQTHRKKEGSLVGLVNENK